MLVSNTGLALGFVCVHTYTLMYIRAYAQVDNKSDMIIYYHEKGGAYNMLR